MFLVMYTIFEKMYTITNFKQSIKVVLYYKLQYQYIDIGMYLYPDI